METSKNQQSETQATTQQIAKLSFMDKQFRNVSGCGFWALIVIIPFLALVFGLVGLLTCKDAEARKRAVKMTAVAGIWFIICLLALLVQIASLHK